MRISDWSSDVCSSDLGILAVAAHADTGERRCHVGLAEAPVRGGRFDAAGTLVEVGARGPVVAVGAGEGLGRRLRAAARSAGRRVGKECVSTGRYRWSPYH